MTFEQPLALAVAPAVLALWLVLWIRRARAPFPVRRLAALVPAGVRRRSGFLAPSCRGAALLLAAAALAGPRAGVERVQVVARGIDIQLVLDQSSSMSRSDLASGRTLLERVVEVLDRFVAGRADDRIGLISFARFPRVVCPLTLDHEHLRAFAGQVRTARPDTEQDGTGIGVALATAVYHLRESDAPSKVAVLLTDGEETVHDVEPEEAAELAVAHGVKVYTVAAGARSGKSARALTRVAERTGGRGFAAADAGELAAVYQEIDRLERVEREEVRLATFADASPQFLLGAAALLVLGLLLDGWAWRRVP